jgi:hypothetical protein
MGTIPIHPQPDKSMTTNITIPEDIIKQWSTEAEEYAGSSFTRNHYPKAWGDRYLAYLAGRRAEYIAQQEKSQRRLSTAWTQGWVARFHHDKNRPYTSQEQTVIDIQNGEYEKDHPKLVRSGTRQGNNNQ